MTNYYLLYELRVTFYKLPFIAGVTSKFLHTSYELLFIACVTMSYFLHASYKLTFFTRGTSKILLASFDLLFIARVTGCLLHTSHETGYLINYKFLSVNDQ